VSPRLCSKLYERRPTLVSLAPTCVENRVRHEGCSCARVFEISHKPSHVRLSVSVYISVCLPQNSTYVLMSAFVFLSEKTRENIDSATLLFVFAKTRHGKFYVGISGLFSKLYQVRSCEIDVAALPSYVLSCAKIYFKSTMSKPVVFTKNLLIYIFMSWTPAQSRNKGCADVVLVFILSTACLGVLETMMKKNYVFGLSFRWITSLKYITNLSCALFLFSRFKNTLKALMCWRTTSVLQDLHTTRWCVCLRLRFSNSSMFACVTARSI